MPRWNDISALPSEDLLQRQPAIDDKQFASDVVVAEGKEQNSVGII